MNREVGRGMKVKGVVNGERGRTSTGTKTESGITERGERNERRIHRNRVEMGLPVRPSKSQDNE